MQLPTLQSKVCDRTDGHCEFCRSERGAQLGAEWAKVYAFDAEADGRPVCPHKREMGWKRPPKPVQVTVRRAPATVKLSPAAVDVTVTRALWAELHRYTFTATETAVAWFAGWLSRVPCGSCRAHAEDALRDEPFDFSTPETFIASAVRLHNAVNRRPELGKPEWTIDAARERWLTT